ncbi:hypothetical protein SO694_00103087 [Aureococcus anophagefferens]|uniref:Uncharacterized protein n=1 Tax=Aureococcus anophagefferens TaxID=44056 RepID=A0ABR1FN30_AURAN
MRALKLRAPSVYIALVSAVAVGAFRAPLPSRRSSTARFAGEDKRRQRLDPRFGFFGFELIWVLADAARQVARGSTRIGDLVIAAPIPPTSCNIRATRSSRVYWQGDDDGAVRRVDVDDLDADRPPGCERYEKYLALYSPRYHAVTGAAAVRPDEAQLIIPLRREVADASVLAIPGFFWVAVCYNFIEYGKATGRM